MSAVQPPLPAARPDNPTYIRRRRLICMLIKSVRLVQEKFWKTTRSKPWKATLVVETAKRKTPIALQTVPSNNSRSGWNPGHRLNGIPHNLPNMSDVNHAR